MSDDTTQELISKYQESVRARARARWCISGIVLCAIAVFCLQLWRDAVHFSNYGVGEVKEQVSNHLLSNSSSYLQPLSQATSQVAERYQRVILNQIEKDLPKFEAVAHRELVKLEQFSQKRWQDFEREFQSMATEQMTVVTAALEGIVGKERATQIAKHYGNEVDREIATLLNTAFAKQIKVGENIAHNVDRLSELEPRGSKPISVHQSIGLALELAGLEMQEMDS